VANFPTERTPPWAEPLGLALAAMVLYGDIVSQIESAILSLFQSVWNGIESFFGTIFSAIANTFATIFNAPVGAIQASFTTLTNSASGFGVFAPVVVIVIVAAVLIIATYLIWLIIKVSASEGEKTVEEGEEGV
jgi:hypothetical protein